MERISSWRSEDVTVVLLINRHSSSLKIIPAHYNRLITKDKNTLWWFIDSETDLDDHQSLNAFSLCLSLFLISSSSICPLHLVTMQIYLRPLSRRTGSTETLAPAVTMTKTAVEQSKAVDVRSPAFTALVQKSSCQKYKSPVKSPSQYFQICYWSQDSDSLVLVLFGLESEEWGWFISFWCRITIKSHSYSVWF